MRYDLCACHRYGLRKPRFLKRSGTSGSHGSARGQQTMLMENVIHMARRSFFHPQSNDLSGFVCFADV